MTHGVFTRGYLARGYLVQVEKEGACLELVPMVCCLPSRPPKCLVPSRFVILSALLSEPALHQVDAIKTYADMHHVPRYCTNALLYGLPVSPRQS